MSDVHPNKLVCCIVKDLKAAVYVGSIDSKLTHQALEQN